MAPDLPTMTSSDSLHRTACRGRPRDHFDITSGQEGDILDMSKAQFFFVDLSWGSSQKNKNMNPDYIDRVFKCFRLIDSHILTLSHPSLYIGR